MKAVIGFALGFMVARQLYLKYDKQKALEIEARVKKRLGEFLSENGLSEKESKAQVKEILKK